MKIFTLNLLEIEEPTSSRTQMHQYTDFAPDLTITKKPLHSHCAVILGVSTNATSGQDSGTFSQLTSFANPNEEICRMIENSIKK